MYNKQDLEDLLNIVKGKVFKNFNLGKLTFFKAGGNADYLFVPKNLEDLQIFLQNKNKNVPVFVLGAGSNLLVRDGGVEGVTIKLSNFNKVSMGKNNIICAETGALDKSVAIFAKDNNIEGLEFLYTIPGSIGGALAMNAGAYGKEFKDVFFSTTAIDMHGNIKEITNKDVDFSYRNSTFKEKKQLILINVKLKAEVCTNKEKIIEKMNEMNNKRLQSQPLANQKTAGSTFRNHDKFKAWELIQKVNGQNLEVGDAKVSSKHCNFLLNSGSASGKDIERLGELIRLKVKECLNIDLIWEIKIVGRANK